jgi:hypothetical protein
MMRKCPICDVLFDAPAKQLTCSILCGRKAMHRRRAEKYGKPRKCKHCGSEWIAMPKDTRKFCSWECHAADKGHRPQKEVECSQCGNIFQVLDSLSREGRGVYCSKRCAYDARINRTPHTCECCGRPYDVEKSRDVARFCSRDCYIDFTNAERSPSWKGGEFIEKRKGHVMRYRRIDGNPRTHHPLHRLVAGDVLGRNIEQGEIVIHLDRDPKNNAPSNLYIFGCRSDWARTQMGSLDWPEKSNLNTYSNDDLKRPERPLSKKGESRP